jgi:Zn-dependent M16 (insulinase) family peptidase
LQNLVENELKRLSEQGLDKKLIEATINSKEFYLREADMSHFPKGLYYNMAALNTWLHSGDPTLYLKFEPMLEYLRTGLHEPLFENLIKQGMLENPHSSLIILKPEAGLNEQKDAVVTKFLADYKAALSPEQIQALIAENNALLAWQSQPDDPADIEKIPCISKADISPSAPDRGSETETIDGITWLKHSTFTNGIAYLHAAFEINHIALEDLPWLSLLVDMVGNLNTTNYSYAELNNEIDIHTGGVYIDLSLNNDNRDFSNILPKVMLSSKCVLSKLEQTLELMAEYGFNTVFSDTNRISQLLKESKSRIQMMIISSGHLIAIRKLVGQFSQLQALNDATEGMGYYSFLCEVESQLEINPEVVVNKLSLLSKQIFKRNNLLLSITAEKSVIPMIQSAMQSFIAKIPTPDVHPVDWQIILNKSNLGIYAPINVQYCAQGGNFVKHGYQYSGKMMVLANILRNDFLMQELRVKGGAYGIMLGFVRNGNMYFCSYRDPNLSETLDVYDQVADFVEGFTCSQRDLDKYIIGTMAELEMPKTPRQTGWESLSDYITGLSWADHQKIRTEVLTTTLEDIRAYAPLIRKVMTDNQYCVFGSENKVKAHSNLFDRVVAAIS